MKLVKHHKAFTMIELLFVIVILGIVGGLALESIRQYYNGIYQTGEYTKRVAEADHILEQISKYFENGISASIIRLDENDATGCYGIPINADTDKDYTIAFVAVDTDGLRGAWNTTLHRLLPTWSSDALSIGNTLISLDANFTALNNMSPLVDANNPTAIFRSEGLAEGTGECSRFGWANASNTYDAYRTITHINGDHNLTLNGILSIGGNANRAYVLRTAYAFRAKNGQFNMYSNFQPWNNERYSNSTAHLLGNKVTHFTILYDSSNTKMNSNVGNIYTLKICMEGLDENLSDSILSKNQICRERMVHVRY
jgi:prepilin-type N-terminal cleavage/methylation domain-containing protein